MVLGIKQILKVSVVFINKDDIHKLTTFNQYEIR